MTFVGETLQTATLTPRSAKYDNIKALLIFLVVMGHSLYRCFAIDALGVFLYIFIYSFHMPAFMYLFGKFAKPNARKIGNFLILYIVFQLAYVMFLKYVCGDEALLSLFTPQWLMWFLPACIVYMLLLYVVPGSLSNGQKAIILLFAVIVALLIGFVPSVGDSFALSRTVAFLPFFLAGRFGTFEKKSNVVFAIACFVFALFLVFIYILINSGRYGALYMNHSYVETSSSWYIRLLVFVIACCMIRFLIVCMPDKRIPVITDIGKHTLVIYLGHGFILRGLLLVYTPSNPLLFAVITSVLILLLLWALAVLFKKFKQKHIVFKGGC